MPSLEAMMPMDDDGGVVGGAGIFKRLPADDQLPDPLGS
jgi:hypothetical protein